MRATPTRRSSKAETGTRTVRDPKVPSSPSALVVLATTSPPRRRASATTCWKAWSKPPTATSTRTVPSLITRSPGRAGGAGGSASPPCPMAASSPPPDTSGSPAAGSTAESWSTAAPSGACSAAPESCELVPSAPLQAASPTSRTAAKPSARRRAAEPGRCGMAVSLDCEATGDADRLLGYRVRRRRQLQGFACAQPSEGRCRVVHGRWQQGGATDAVHGEGALVGAQVAPAAQQVVGEVPWVHDSLRRHASPRRGVVLQPHLPLLVERSLQQGPHALGTDR